MNKLFVLFLLCACTPAPKLEIAPELTQDFELSVFCEVLPDMIDSLWVEHSTEMDPYIWRHGSEEEDQDWSRDEIQRHLVKRGFQFVIDNCQYPFHEGPLKLVMSDTMNVRELTDQMIDYWAHLSPNELDKEPQGELSLNRSCIWLSERFQFADGRADKHERNKYGIAKAVFGDLAFSRIQFDKSGRYGIVECRIDIGLNWVFGYHIFIRLYEDRWLVNAIKEAWIA
jgi:hypothetical protein